jgi:hypothetical protein
MFGMCYGSKEQVSSIVRKYVQVDWLVGREFWEFISGDPNCIEEIYGIAAEVGRNFQDESGQTLAEVVANKIDELEEDFIEMYGKDGEEMWRNLLVENS